MRTQACLHVTPLRQENALGSRGVYFLDLCRFTDSFWSGFETSPGCLGDVCPSIAVLSPGKGRITDRTEPDITGSAENDDNDEEKRGARGENRLNPYSYPYRCDVAHPLQWYSGQQPTIWDPTPCVTLMFKGNLTAPWSPGQSRWPADLDFPSAGHSLRVFYRLKYTALK